MKPMKNSSKRKRICPYTPNEMFTNNLVRSSFKPKFLLNHSPASLCHCISSIHQSPNVTDIPKISWWTKPFSFGSVDKRITQKKNFLHSYYRRSKSQSVSRSIIFIQKLLMVWKMVFEWMLNNGMIRKWENSFFRAATSAQDTVEKMNW